VREPEPVEAAPSGAELDMPGVGGPEPRSTATTQATVEVIEAKTFVRDAGRADVKESREVVEAPAKSPSLVLVINDTKLLIPCVKCLN
jgi:hypothetical protein